ncbi:undecaprenyldiphospho-muramoylpentapeptide beta-N-acetylglucosaminyltransferase [Paenibacillus guangzhouensis]|uniref:undecaprenyldiphospho-muramoylpentapeptide beta-N-acetylglucosaminyltransferase n=1 Tax=Paenibacillus guangzhouensis TaxID=1473112 RepID=UPI001266C4BA|nr:undecaprenyldiphospho-muramoylpentapeptide beta-N-acetylglucosaminyltransferase [Paenibacillus guangzhouensis]
MAQKKRILFTGGGSAGHVTVNLALIPKLQAMGWDIQYMGSKLGIESQLIHHLPEVQYHSISTGKLRRYIAIENFKDPFRVIHGVYEAYRKIRTIKPDIVFSKGGFVSVPVVLGAWLNKVPVIIHESDMTPGLANKIALPFANKICLTFKETGDHMRSTKAMHVGAVIREEIFLGNAERGRSRVRFDKKTPVLLIMGGSLGAHVLTKTFQIVHICGKGQVDRATRHPRYVQYEYIHEELADVLAMTDMVITRAGSNSIFEFLALNKPMLLIPLSRASSRGDQILNAESFHQQGYSELLMEEDLTDASFLASIEKLYTRREEIASNMRAYKRHEAVDRVLELIGKVAK